MKYTLRTVLKNKIFDEGSGTTHFRNKKKAISQELNVGLTSNQAVNLSFFVV